MQKPPQVRTGTGPEMWPPLNGKSPRLTVERLLLYVIQCKYKSIVRETR